MNLSTSRSESAKTDAAGNITEKHNFEWFYTYAVQYKEEVGEVRRTQGWVVVLNPDGSVRDGSPGVEIPLACTAPCEVVTPYSNFTWDDMPSSPEQCRAEIAR